jgi:hypothetical protein
LVGTARGDVVDVGCWVTALLAGVVVAG